MVIIIIFTTFSQKLKMSLTGTVTPAVDTAIGECEEGGLNGCACLRGRIVIPPPSLKWLLSLRGTSGEGWGEGLLPSNYSALLNSPLPTSLSWGEGIDRGLGGGNKMRPIGAWLPEKNRLKDSRQAKLARNLNARQFSLSYNSP